MSSFIVRKGSEDSSAESAEEDLSDFQAPNDDNSSSSTESSGPESGGLPSPCASFGEPEHIARRNNIDTRGPAVPPVTHIMPPYGRVGFTSKIPQEIVLEIFQDELNYHASIGNKQLHPFSFFSP